MEVDEIKEDPYVRRDPLNMTYTHLIQAIWEYADVLDPVCTKLLEDRDIVFKLVEMPVNKVGSKSVAKLYLRLA